MESTFVFILMLAGLAVVLLGMVLIASERELKNKRREIEGLLERLEAPPQTPPGEVQPSDAASAELMERNRALESNIRALSSELAQNREIVAALQAVQNADAGMQEKVRELTSVNEQLLREADDLRSRLAASEREFQNARHEENGPALSRMQAEIDELRRALETSHAQVTELEEARKNLPDLQAIAAERETERQSHRAELAELEKRLAEQREALAEAHALRQQLAEAASQQKILRDEVLRYEEEMPRWQARIAAAEEAASRLAALQAPYEELLAIHTDLSDRQRHLQEVLADLGRRITPAASGEAAPAARVEAGAPTGSPAPKLVPFDDQTSRGPAHSPEQSVDVTDPRTRRFGVLSALLFIGATGVVGAQFLGSEWEHTGAEAMPAQATAQIAPQVSRTTELPEEHIPVAERPGAAVSGAPSSDDAAPLQKQRAAERSKPAVLPRTAASGTYEVVRPSRVYRGPTELSQALGDIEPGVKVNVVDNRDGWLEIHSKHGRPPGFIRREVAARVGSPN